MLRCAPFVVIYAEFLLLAQYLYGMNLTEEELPSTGDVSFPKFFPINSQISTFNTFFLLFLRCKE